MGCDANPWLLNPTVVAAIVAMGSLVVRHFGVVAERTLRGEWGDFPTTIIMRWSEDKRSAEWKRRMHQLVKEKLGLELLSEEEEKIDPEEADRRITDAFGKIRTRIWSRKDLPCHAANIDYGFARNLYGARWIWLGITIACLAASVSVSFIYKESLPLINIGILTLFVILVPVLEWKAIKPQISHCAYCYAEHAWEYLERM